MFKLILLAWIIYILFKWLRRSSSPAPKPRPFDPAPGPAVEEMVQDPVCGIWLPVGQAVSIVQGREKRHFCSAECRDKFRAGQGQEK